MDVEARIRDNKPDISESSVRTYTSVINNLCKKMDISPSQLLKSPKKAIDFLKDTEPAKRKGQLASLIVFIGDKEKDTKGAGVLDNLRSMMKDDITVYNTSLKKQNMTERDEKNWIDWGDVQQLLKDTWKHDIHLVKKSGTLSKDEKKRLTNLILLAVYSMIPPRRSEDYTHFKIRNHDENDNFLDKKGFKFSQYKTSKTYGDQIVPIPKKLRNLIEGVASRNDWGDYLLTSSTGKPITSSQLTALLNKLFGKKVSTSLLRKSYLTDRYKNVPELESIQETSQAMGNSFEAALSNYVKPEASKKNKKE